MFYFFCFMWTGTGAARSARAAAGQALQARQPLPCTTTWSIPMTLRRPCSTMVQGRGAPTFPTLKTSTMAAIFSSVTAPTWRWPRPAAALCIAQQRARQAQCQLRLMPASGTRDVSLAGPHSTPSSSTRSTAVNSVTLEFWQDLARAGNSVAVLSSTMGRPFQNQINQMTRIYY